MQFSVGFCYLRHCQQNFISFETKIILSESDTLREKKEKKKVNLKFHIAVIKYTHEPVFLCYLLQTVLKYSPSFV